jgi:hypothetical protein
MLNGKFKMENGGFALGEKIFLARAIRFSETLSFLFSLCLSNPPRGWNILE